MPFFLLKTPLSLSVLTSLIASLLLLPPSRTQRGPPVTNNKQQSIGKRSSATFQSSLLPSSFPSSYTRAAVSSDAGWSQVVMLRFSLSLSFSCFVFFFFIRGCRCLGRFFKDGWNWLSVISSNSLCSTHSLSLLGTRINVLSLSLTLFLCLPRLGLEKTGTATLKLRALSFPLALSIFPLLILTSTCLFL